MVSPPPGPEHDAALWRDDFLAAPRQGWLGSLPAGLLVGLLGVGACSLLILLVDRLFFTFPSPSLVYLPLIAAVAYGWGARAGAVTAAASFLIVWYAFLAPRASLALTTPSEWTRLILIAICYGALVLLGDAVRRLRLANSRLETIIASIADGILVVDRHGELLQTNDAMRRLLGGEVPRALTARNAQWQTRAGDGKSLALGEGPTSRALRGETTTGTELLVRNAAGRDLTVSISSAPLLGRSGRILGAAIVCRDITEMRRLQQAKDDFLSIASHELKTPLTALGGYAQLLRQRLARIELQDERATRYLGALETQSRRLGELVNSLLDVARLDAGRLHLRRAPCDLVGLVGQVAGQIGDLSSRHALVLEAPDTLIGAWDRERVEQVVVNLLTNAIRYSPAGGPIVVTVGIAQQFPDEVAPSCALPAPVAFVRVRDQGLGIPPDQLDAIFERFHRSHADADDGTEARRGIGLGLFISREIVERHGGCIWANSPGPGQGATFTFTLPLDPSATTIAEPAILGDGETATSTIGR